MKKILNSIKWLLFIFFIIIYVLAIYVNKEFDFLPFEQLIFSLFNSEGTSMFAIKDGIIFVGGWSFVIIGLVMILRYILFKFKNLIFIDIKFFKFEISFDSVKFISGLFGIFISIFCLYSIAVNYGLIEYIKSQSESSSLFENYYVEPDSVSINFPKNKKNLIYIVMESMESSNFSKENGGVRDKSYIPKLEKMAENYTSFSNTDNLGGIMEAELTGWTAASLIAQSAGIPLKLNIAGNEYSGFSGSFPGAITIGDILEDNGYKNYFMLGSDATFGGRKDFYVNHGNYTIYDYNYAKEHDWIPEDYKEWWGYEDSKLFEFAKKELTEIAKNNEPFNFTMLTADTHFFNGYIDKTCSDKVFDSHYANSYYCSDSFVDEFIKWIQKQDFYKNTIIVIVGDHKTMQNDFFSDGENELRTTYNVIINSELGTENTKNRTFNIMDMYPTTLAALGVEIEGDRLALGTNLYSKTKTYMEELGYEYFNSEILKKSNYYNNKLLSNTYFEIEEVVNKGKLEGVN